MTDLKIWRDGLMKTRMILIRHGDTGYEWGTFVGKTDVPLRDGALDEARELGRKLRGERITRLYSSRMVRAVETAGAIGKELGLQVQEKIRELNEMDFGRWEMRTPEDVMRNDPKILEIRKREIETFREHGGESVSDVRKRVLPVFQRLMKDNEGKTFAVVAHGSLMKIFKRTVTGGEVSPAEKLKFLAAMFFKKDGDKIELEKQWGVH